MEGKELGNTKQEDTDKKNHLVRMEIESIFRWVDSLDKGRLVRHLKKYNENTNGSTETLKKRLKSVMQTKKLDLKNNGFSSHIKTLFPYYVVLDFEATCLEVNPPNFPHEIIEFPAVLVNTEKNIIVDKFQAYVKPVLNPKLSEFCKTLTGITQEQVDSSMEFPEVLVKFELWLAKHKLGTKNKFAMVTDGPWDMGRFLYNQCILSNIPYPNFAKKWVNLRKIFSSFYKSERLRLQLMLEKLDMKFVGQPHCGLDDATNIALLLLRMIQDGAGIDVNERIQLRHKPDLLQAATDSTGDKVEKQCDSNDENAAYSSNQAMKNSWPVKPYFPEGPRWSYSQTLKNKQTSDAISSLNAEMKRHNVHTNS